MIKHLKLRRLLPALLVVALALSLVAPAFAQANATIVNASRVNLRSGPGAGYPIVTVLSFGQQLFLLGSNADGSWVQVQTTSNTIGWVNARFVASYYGPQTVPVTAPTGSWNAVITSPFLNIRSGPGANFPDVGTLAQGQGINLIGRNADNSWVQVNVPGGVQGGWVSTRYVSASLPVGNLPLVSNTGVFPTFPQPVPPVVGAQTGIVTAPNLNVRYGPSTGNAAFTRLRQGEGVSLVGRSGNGAWLLVQLANGTTGWVSTGFIFTTFPVWNLPVRA